MISNSEAEPRDSSGDDLVSQRKAPGSSTLQCQNKQLIEQGGGRHSSTLTLSELLGYQKMICKYAYNSNVKFGQPLTGLMDRHVVPLDVRNNQAYLHCL